MIKLILILRLLRQDLQQLHSFISLLLLLLSSRDSDKKIYYFDIHHFYFSSTSTSSTTFTGHDQDNSFFVSLLRSLRHDQKKNNNLVTTFTTSWPRVVSLFLWFRHYVQYAMIKRKIFYFSLLWLRYNYEKNGVFCFIGTFVHYGNIFLHELTSTYCTHYVTKISE